MDRGECQTNALVLGGDFMGEADYCIVPVFINLYLTLLLQNWVFWIFLCVLEQRGEAHWDDKIEAKIDFMNQALTFSIYLLSLYFLPGYDHVCIKTAVVATGISSNPFVKCWIKRIIQNEESYLHRPAVAFYGAHNEAHYAHDAPPQDNDHEHHE